MHELALTEGIVSAVRERVPHGQVTRVMLQVGKLSGVVVDSLRFYFELCARGTGLEGAALEIEEVSGRMLCRRCEQESAADGLLLTCPCGSLDVELVRGQELLLKAVEVI